MNQPLIAMQVGAISFADEGVTAVLDQLEESAGVNALFLATPTWVRGTGGRQVPGYPMPDHGSQDPDPEYVGGSYTPSNPEYYRSTTLGTPPRPPELPEYDLLDEVLAESRSRGMANYAWMEESSYVQAIRDIPGMPRTLEVDVWDRPSMRPCFNNPDYKGWWLAIVEDYVKSHDLDGLAWCSERPGPLNYAIQKPVTASNLGCFCTHCRQIAREQGIDPERAKAGMREILHWNERASSSTRMNDGAFTSFWRILLNYPEVLGWQNLWTQSQRQMYRDIYGVAKASDHTMQVGWHVYHDISFSPFYRADQDYADLAHCSDFIKVVTYNNCAGPRFRSWIDGISQTLFADVRNKNAVHSLVLDLLNLDESDYDSIHKTGFSAEYVRRETARAVAGVGDGTKILPGIDIDIPVGQTSELVADRQKRFESSGGINNDLNHFDPDVLSQCSPEGVRDAVLAAFEGGADGVVLSRKYSEMRLANLGGVGAALEALRSQRS